MLVCWGILLKIEPELQVLKVGGFFLGTLIWQRLTNVPCLPTNHRERCGIRSTLEVKICRGRIILAWLTPWKYLE